MLDIDSECSLVFEGRNNAVLESVEFDFELSELLRGNHIRDSLE
jgi:hypothetical protein